MSWLTTLGNSGGTPLVTKTTGSSGNWGTRSPGITLTEGRTYTLSYAYTRGACANNSLGGWRILDASLNTVASGTVSGTGTTVIMGTFTISATGTYYIEFYRNASFSGNCAFNIDNVSLTYITYSHSTGCSSNPADMYLWGHNGQHKDNEIYGRGTAYTAEYWEYDARLIRRWNTDPIEYPWQSVYTCFNNNPVYFTDPLGLEGQGGGGKSRPKFEDKKTKKGRNKKDQNDDDTSDNEENNEQTVYDFTYEYRVIGQTPGYGGYGDEDSYKPTKSNDGTDAEAAKKPKPLFKNTFEQYYREAGLCSSCNEGQWQNFIGSEFETHFENSIRNKSGLWHISSNFQKYNGPAIPGGNDRNVKPDFTADYEHRSNFFMRENLSMYEWYELKAKSGGLYMSSNKWQIKGQIDALHNMHRQTYLRTNVKPRLIVVTTYDVDLSPYIFSYAASRNVVLIHLVAYYTINEYGYMELSYFPAIMPILKGIINYETPIK